MNWEAIGAVGEIVGALAVVVTLGYLAVQTRHVNRTARSDARQRILDEWSSALSNFIGSEATRTVLFRGLEDRESLDPADYLLFNHWLNVFGTNLFNALRLRQEGILDEEAFDFISKAFVGTCRTPGGSVWWQEQAAFFPPSLVRFVNAQIATSPGLLPDVSGLYGLGRAVPSPERQAP